MQYNQLDESIRKEMRRLQKEQQGHVQDAVFQNKLTACKAEGGINWPLPHYELWSEALREGKPERLLRALTKSRVAKPHKPKDVADPDTRQPFETPEDCEKRLKAKSSKTAAPAKEKRKYTRKPPVIVEQGKHPVIVEQGEPAYYKQPDGITQVIDMMLALYGKEAVKHFCQLNAFKYRMRAGRKSGETVERDIEKALWYEAKVKELCGAAV